MQIQQLLAEHAARSPHTVALEAPGYAPLTFADLYDHLEQIVARLRAAGIGRNDRVAIVLPNGPHMAVAFLGVTAGATSAPLNPAYRQTEFEFYLEDLKAKAVLVARALDSPVRAAARALDIPILEVDFQPGGCAGAFSFQPQARGAVSHAEWAHAEDIALVLHTSGTTSRPKLVPLTHANLCASAANIVRTLELTPADTCLNIMPLFHIHGLLAALLASLTAGASVVCAPGLIAPKFLDWLAEFRPTWYTAVPTLHQQILAHVAGKEAHAAHTSLRFIRSSSAALPSTVLFELERVFQAPVVEAYGMTEAAHQIASNPLPPRARQGGSVGVAAGPEIAILDEQGVIVNGGSTGEVIIRGENVTRGYEHNPQANADAFVNGWFRTGDLGYLDDQGYLHLTGRIKELINRGGEKIAPLQVDRVLLTHPAVAQAVTFAFPDARLGEDVAAVVVLQDGKQLSEWELREFAATQLADFQVPRRVLFRDTIPTGPTGKVQRRGLAAQLGLTAEPSAETRTIELVPPRTALEIALAALWAETLGKSQFGVNETFLELGGDSILGAQLLARVRDAFGVELPFIAIFDRAATVAGMAVMLEERRRAVPRAAPALPPAVPAEQNPPLSFVQARFWFLQQLEPETNAYNRSLSFRLKGNLEVEYLQKSLDEIVRRHSILRSRIANVDGSPVQTILPDAPLKPSQLDLTALPAERRDDELERVVRAEFAKPFDLAAAAPMRVTLIQLDAQEYLLLVVTHHSAFDGWADLIFLRELSELSSAFAAGAPPALPELHHQYADFARAERAWAESDALAESLAYWKEQLGGEIRGLDLPTDRPRPAIPSHHGATLFFDIPREVVRALEEMARREGVTPFMLLLAALQALLFRYTGQPDIIVGVPAAGRTGEDAGALLGCFMKMMVLRTQVKGGLRFGELLASVRAVALGAYAHEDMPVEKLVSAVQPERSLSRNPLFQVLFQLRNLPTQPLVLPGIEVDEWRFEEGLAPTELTIELQEQDSGLRGLIDYSTDLFDRETIGQLAHHFQVLLSALPGARETPIAQLPLLTDQERHRILVEWNATAAALREICIHDLVAEWALATPEAVGVVFNGVSLTHRGLNERANQLAHYLIARGVTPEVMVGIALERSLEMVVSVLAVLKAGGAFVPLDPTYPRERLAYMLTDIHAPVLITQSSLLKSLPAFDGHVLCLDTEREAIAQELITNPRVPVTPQNLAYVMYTSGSTGKPKGVMIRHDSVVNLCQANPMDMLPSTPYRMVAISSMSFDGWIYEIFLPLTHGGTIILADEEAVYDGARLAALIDASDATMLDARPSVCQLLLDAGWKGKPQLRIALGGEVLERTLADRLLDLDMSLWNPYGPTEATVEVTKYRVARGTGPVPLGKPIPNTLLLVLDAQMQPAPPRVPGDLYIGGICLARGYLNQPDLTRERFVPNPFLQDAGGTAQNAHSTHNGSPSVFPSPTLYNTGDRARYLHDGTLEFLGRQDSQVKLHGYRIELGEIEAALSVQPGISRALVLRREDEPGNPRLVAYLVSRAGAQPETTALRAALAQTLPDYMLPAAFVFLERVPTLPNGKPDRRALPAPTLPRAAESRGPRTATETRIAEIWCRVLRVEQVGVDVTFFELGGSSLIAAQVISRLRQAFHTEIPLRSIFEHSTVAGMALWIDRLMANGAPAASPPMLRQPRKSQEQK